MLIQFSLFAASLLACGVLFTTAYAGHGSGGQKQDVRPNGRGDRIRGTPPKASTGTVATGNGINYHNGPVLHTVNVYYIWYGDWNGLDPTGPPILTDFVSNEGGSSYFDINTTYGDTTGGVPNAVTFAGQTTVAGNSTSLADDDIANIVATALVQFGGTPDTNAVYFVLTAPGINETSGFLTQYCGWHNHGSFPNGGTTWDIKYSFVGNASGPSLGRCAAQTSNSPYGDFLVSASPSSQSVVQGSAATYNVAVTPLEGFSATVSLSAGGLPPDASATFSPASISGGSGSSTLNITTSSSSQFGNYPIT